MNQKTIYRLCYALFFLLVLLAGFLEWDLVSVLLQPIGYLILFLYLKQSVPHKGRFHKRLMKALVLSCLTDLLFQFSGSHTGLLIFALFGLLGTHLAYISAFYLDFKSAQELDKKGAKLSIFGTALFFTGFYLQLRPFLGSYRLPAIAAIFVISFLLMMALFRNHRVNKDSFLLILTGVIFFVLADAALMYTHFTHTLSQIYPGIYAFYLIAQFLIISGGIRRILIHQQTEI